VAVGLGSKRRNGHPRTRRDRSDDHLERSPLRAKRAKIAFILISRRMTTINNQVDRLIFLVRRE